MMNTPNENRPFIKTFTLLKIKDDARCTRRTIGKPIHNGPKNMQVKGRRITKRGMTSRQLIRSMNILCFATYSEEGELKLYNPDSGFFKINRPKMTLN